MIVRRSSDFPLIHRLRQAYSLNLNSIFQIQFYIRHFLDLKLPLEVTPLAILVSIFPRWPFI